MVNKPDIREYSVLSHAPWPLETEASPPFQTRNTGQIYIIAHLPGELGFDLLPPELRPLPGNVWVLGFYTAGEGWGLGPFSAFYAGIAVEGHDSPSGLEGVFMVAGRYSGRAGRVFPARYNRVIRCGEVSFNLSETEATGCALLDDGPGEVRVRVGAGVEPPEWSSGTASYLGVDPTGATTQWTVAYSARFSTAQNVDLTFALPEDHRLQVLRHLEVDQVLIIRDMTQTFSAPVPIDADAQAHSDPLATLDLLSHLGRALAVIETTGRLLYLSPAGGAILGPRPALGPVVLPHRRLTSSPEQQDCVSPVLLTLSGGQQIIATAIPIALRLSEAPAMLVLLNDPRHPGPADPEPLLRLMGLTPSEAAIAALIGAGATPAEAAAARGITQSTTRSTLKVIFSKLGLRRQADLAQIVTRLQMG